MVTHTQESGFKIENMVKESTSMLMVLNILDNGSTVKNQDLVAMSGRMVPGMKANMTKVTNMGKVN